MIAKGQNLNQKYLPSSGKLAESSNWTYVQKILKRMNLNSTLNVPKASSSEQFQEMNLMIFARKFGKKCSYLSIKLSVKLT